jgi:prevent-host-death family protein
MQVTTSAEFHRRIGHFQDRALVEPIIITRNGRARVVLISAEQYERLTGARFDFKEYLTRHVGLDEVDLTRDQNPDRDVAL